MYIQGNPV